MGLDVLVIVVDQVLVGLVLVLVGVVLQRLGQELPTETLMCVAAAALSAAIKPLVLAITLQWILLAVTLDRLRYGLYPERRTEQAVRSSAVCSLVLQKGPSEGS